MWLIIPIQRCATTILIMVIATMTSAVTRISAAPAPSRVVVFVLDSGFNSGHGEVVVRAVEESFQGDIVTVDVGSDVDKGRISTARALAALVAVDSQTATFPEARIVVNMSWGATAEDPALAAIIERLQNRGVAFVASAGNEGLPTCAYPAALPGVIAVGSAIDTGGLRKMFTTNYERAPYSNYGPCVSMFVLDSAVTELLGTGEFRFRFHSTEELENSIGTSFTAPIVAGTIARVLSVNPDLSTNEAIELVKSAATNSGLRVSGIDVFHGGAAIDEARRLYVRHHEGPAFKTKPDEELLQLLDTDHGELRRLAIEEIGRRRLRAGVPRLTQMLAATNTTSALEYEIFCATAVRALGLMGPPPEAEQSLLQTIGDPSCYGDIAVEDIAARLDTPGVANRLVRMLIVGWDDEGSRRAQHALRQMTTPSAIAGLRIHQLLVTADVAALSKLPVDEYELLGAAQRDLVYGKTAQTALVAIGPPALRFSSTETQRMINVVVLRNGRLADRFTAAIELYRLASDDTKSTITMVVVITCAGTLCGALIVQRRRRFGRTRQQFKAAASKVSSLIAIGDATQIPVTMRCGSGHEALVAYAVAKVQNQLIAVKPIVSVCIVCGGTARSSDLSAEATAFVDKMMIAAKQPN